MDESGGILEGKINANHHKPEKAPRGNGYPKFMCVFSSGEPLSKGKIGLERAEIVKLDGPDRKGKRLDEGRKP